MWLFLASYAPFTKSLFRPLFLCHLTWFSLFWEQNSRWILTTFAAGFLILVGNFHSKSIPARGGGLWGLCGYFWPPTPLLPKVFSEPSFCVFQGFSFHLMRMTEIVTSQILIQKPRPLCPHQRFRPSLTQIVGNFDCSLQAGWVLRVLRVPLQSKLPY